MESLWTGVRSGWTRQESLPAGPLWAEDGAVASPEGEETGATAAAAAAAGTMTAAEATAAPETTMGAEAKEAMGTATPEAPTETTTTTKGERAGVWPHALVQSRTRHSDEPEQRGSALSGNPAGGHRNRPGRRPPGRPHRSPWG
ncbi:uncharacterized protein LOC119929713 isoform X3 [Tachyglossus aculeatus]|uniref:uncharacterized protein LOC119929713 isoform X3 n=1 Tax=Tachyglossus aculeatus TaxID=9261 RepID=UPI0018F5916E|nr:uncharacterized protein LOC119929713 isoform X3 [Tachyglossus aculeatus]